MSRYTKKCDNKSTALYYCEKEEGVIDYYEEGVTGVLNAHYSGEAIDKLGTYEDAEEQGLLLILPCKTGDILYFPTTQIGLEEIEPTVLDVTVDVIKIEGETNLNCGGFYAKHGVYTWWFDFNSIGKKVFLAPEEANHALLQL